MIIQGINQPVIAKLQGAPTGLVGSLTIEIRNSETNEVVFPPTTSGIAEVSTGLYHADLVTPGARGDYDIIWRANTIAVAEHLVVTAEVIDRDLTYAEVSDLVAAGNVDPNLNENVLYKALAEAEKDIDSIFLGRRVVRETGRRFRIEDLDPYQVIALRDATVAQAEFRIEQGDDWFVSVEGKIQGPDYTIERSRSGLGDTVSPRTWQALRLGNLIPRGGRALA